MTLARVYRQGIGGKTIEEGNTVCLGDMPLPLARRTAHRLSRTYGAAYLDLGGVREMWKDDVKQPQPEMRCAVCHLKIGQDTEIRRRIISHNGVCDFCIDAGMDKTARWPVPYEGFHSPDAVRYERGQ